MSTAAVQTAQPTHWTWRPPLYGWLALAVGALGAIHKFAPERLHGGWLLITPVLVLAGVLVLRRLWDLPPAGGLCAALVLTIFSDGWSQLGLGGLPLNRLLILFVFCQFLLRAPGVAHVRKAQIRNVHLLMCFTAMYGVASAAAAGTLGVSAGFLPLIDIFGIVPFLLYFLAPSIFAGQRERDLLLATMVGLGIYLGVTSVFEAVGPHSLVYPSYIIHTDVIAPGAAQVGGPFQSPVAEGFAAFACAVASVIAFTQWRERRYRCLAAFGVIVCGFACFATLERGVWLAAAAAAIATALVTRSGRRWLVPATLACAVGIAGVLTLSSQLSEHTSDRANYKLSVWDRKNQMAAGVRMIQAKPLLGFGWDRYQSDSESYFRQPSDYPMTGHTPGVAIGLPQHVSPLHNTYLAYAVELGLAGSLLWLGSLFLAIGSAIAKPGQPSLRPWKLGLFAISIFFLVVSFFDPHEQPFPIVLLLVWAGVAYGWAPMRERRPKSARSSQTATRPAPA